MNPIVPYEEDNPYKPVSAKDTLAFWEYLYKTGRLIRVLLCILTSLLFLLMLAFVLQGSSGSFFDAYSFDLVAFALIVFVMLIFIIPSMPRLYRVQFKGKFRADVPEDELRELIMAATGKSIEFISLILVVICMLCIVVLEAAGFFSLPGMITLILLATTAIDTIMISLVLISLSQSNRNFLRKTFREQEYKRYSGLSYNKRIFTALAIVNVLVIIALNIAW